jgi:hypothetical protein
MGPESRTEQFASHLPAGALALRLQTSDAVKTMVRYALTFIPAGFSQEALGSNFDRGTGNPARCSRRFPQQLQAHSAAAGGLDSDYLLKTLSSNVLVHKDLIRTSPEAHYISTG